MGRDAYHPDPARSMAPYRDDREAIVQVNKRLETDLQAMRSECNRLNQKLEKGYNEALTGWAVQSGIQATATLTLYTIVAASKDLWWMPSFLVPLLAINSLILTIGIAVRKYS